jgi:nuclear transcription factor Y gamma
MNVQFSVNDRDLLIMDMEGQPSKTTVNEGMTDVDIPTALAAEAPSSAATTTPVSQDAPVNSTIQPQNHQNQVASQQTQQPCDGHQQQQLEAFWSGQLAEINQTTDFKARILPLARIRKVMKDDSDVPRIADEAPVLFEKACEMFIQELTLRAWLHAEEDKRRTLQKSDVAAALAGTDRGL